MCSDTEALEVLPEALVVLADPDTEALGVSAVIMAVLDPVSVDLTEVMGLAHTAAVAADRAVLVPMALIAPTATPTAPAAQHPASPAMRSVSFVVSFSPFAVTISTILPPNLPILRRRP